MKTPEQTTRANRKTLFMVRWLRLNRPDIAKFISDSVDKDFPKPARKTRKYKIEMPESLKELK